MKLLIALAIVITVTVVTSEPAQAQTLDSKIIKNNFFTETVQLPFIKQQQPFEPEPKPEPVIVKEPEQPKPVFYIVQEGDTLTKIAEQYGTTWERIWQKNTDLVHQDQLNVAMSLQIPTSEETLAYRPTIAPPQTQTPIKTAVQASSRQYSYSTSGNTYSYGYCTWYVKNRRPDIPNNLGNANTWYSRASSIGLPVGNTPRVGAIGVTSAGSLGHVVYVEAVNGNGTVTISEMNYAGGWNVVSSRIASAGSFVYIY